MVVVVSVVDDVEEIGVVIVLVVLAEEVLVFVLAGAKQ